MEGRSAPLHNCLPSSESTTQFVLTGKSFSLPTWTAGGPSSELLLVFCARASEGHSKSAIVTLASARAHRFHMVECLRALKERNAGGFTSRGSILTEDLIVSIRKIDQSTKS